MILFTYFINILFLSIESSLLEYNFIKNKVKSNKKLFYLIAIDILHVFSIFINYGFQVFILFSLFLYSKKINIRLILLFNLIWILIFISYYIFDDCLFLKISHYLQPSLSKYRFIDPSERLYYLFDTKLYSANKINLSKNNSNLFNYTLIYQIYFLIIINIVVLIYVFLK